MTNGVGEDEQPLLEETLWTGSRHVPGTCLLPVLSTSASSREQRSEYSRDRSMFLMTHGPSAVLTLQFGSGHSPFGFSCSCAVLRVTLYRLIFSRLTRGESGLLNYFFPSRRFYRQTNICRDSAEVFFFFFIPVTYSDRPKDRPDNEAESCSIANADTVRFQRRLVHKQACEGFHLECNSQTVLAVLIRGQKHKKSSTMWRGGGDLLQVRIPNS